MNLPFAPDGEKKYASVYLVQGIEEAGHELADVQVVVERPEGGWLVFFNSTSDRLII